MSAEVDAFVRAVLRSGLLNREQLQATLRTLPLEQRGEPRRVADHLLQQGRLTPFQVQKLLQGLSIGLVIGPYQIEAILGQGGMGNVYLARDTRQDSHVALKVLPPKRAREEHRQLARFLREKDLAQVVRHPHLALTLEAGEANGIHYLAMEYIPGQTLYRLVNKEGPLSVQRVAGLFTEVTQALAAAHDRGLIHRDLKPSNIMVTPHDHAKVLDLGLAFVKGEEVDDVEVVGGKGYIVGSIDYMAPEQTRDATRIDPRADLYAVGCCMYFALTGKPPFPEGTLKTKVLAHRQLEPEPVRVRQPSVPEGFAQIVQRTLAKQPDARPATAGALAQELQRWSLPTAKPVEMAGDSVYQEAVRHVVTAVPMTEWVEDGHDAFIFKAEPDSAPIVTPPTGKPSGAAEPMPRTLLWLALGLGLFWLFASVVVVAALVIRFLANL